MPVTPLMPAIPAMNARQVVFAKVAVAALALLAADGAAADVTLSVVDATPTARHDGTLPGIGETIFSADVHMELTPGDYWTGAGLGMIPGTIRPNVFFYYTHDPNTGDPILTAPGADKDAQMFSTFVSYPLGQTELRRFRLAASLAGGYWGSPFPIADPTYLSVAYHQPGPPIWESGYTQRVTIDIAESIYARRRVYPARLGTADPDHELLVEFESGALTSDGFIARYRWGFYAVPEPSGALLLLVGLLAAAWLGRASVRRGMRSDRPVLGLACALATSANVKADVILGSQVRVDDTGRFGAAEQSLATNELFPDEVIAAWHHYPSTFSGETLLGFAVSLDAGTTWESGLASLSFSGATCTNAIDPFAFSDSRTGRMWIGALARGCSVGTDRLFVALKNPGEATIGSPVEVVVNCTACEIADGAWGADPSDPNDENSSFLYVVHFHGLQRSADGLEWADPRDPDDITIKPQIGGAELVPGDGVFSRVATGPNGELFVAYVSDPEGEPNNLRTHMRVLVDENDAGRFFDATSAYDPGDPGDPNGFSVRAAPVLRPLFGTPSGDLTPGNLRMPTFPYAAVGPADPADAEQFTVYLVYHDSDPENDDANHPNEKDLDIYFTESTDHGQSWSTPVTICEAPGPAGRSDQVLPILRVTSDGTLHLLYYDTRDTPDQVDGAFDGWYDAYYAFSTDDGDTWIQRRLTQTPFSTLETGIVNPQGDPFAFFGDYLGLAVNDSHVYPCYASTQAGDGNIYVHTIVHDSETPLDDCYTIELGGGASYELTLDRAAPAPGDDFTWSAGVLTLVASGDWRFVARADPNSILECGDPGMAGRADIGHRITIDPDIAGYTSLHLVARDILALSGGGHTLSLDTGEPNDPVGLRLNVRDIYGGVAGNHLRFDDAIGVLGDQGVNTAGTLAPGVVIDVERIGIGTRLEFASLWGDLVCGAAEARGANPSGGGIEAGIAILGVMTGSIRIADDFPGRIEIGGDVDRGQIDIAGDLSGMIDIAGFLDGDIRVGGAMTGAARISTGGQLKLNRVIQVGDPNVALGEIGVDARIDIGKHLVGAIEAGVLRGAITIGKSLGTSGALELDDVKAAGVIEISEHLRGLLDIGGLGADSDLRGLVVVHGDLYDGGQLLVEDTLHGQIRILGSLLDSGGTPNPNEIDLGALASSGAIYDRLRRQPRRDRLRARVGRFGDDSGRHDGVRQHQRPDRARPPCTSTTFRTCRAIATTTGS